MRLSVLLAVPWILVITACVPDQEPAVKAEPVASVAMTDLGNALFHDVTLSSEGNQACATCHDSAHGFADPDASLPVSKGSLAGRFGRRNTPSIAYASLIPPLHAEMEEGEVLWVGGLFLDGRADSLEEQATKPFFEANEMNLADAPALRAKLRASPNAAMFRTVFGPGALDDAEAAEFLPRVGEAIAAFERSSAFHAFSSKFDAYRQGRAQLSSQELEGLSLFVRQDKGNCAACHTLTAGPNGEPPALTDFTYDNLGVPANTAIAIPDIEGLAATPRTGGSPALRGKFRVPTLRNVAITAPYMHNGVFRDLRTVLEFYNTRDTDPSRWQAIGATEVPDTVNRSELGDLRLNDRELSALEAFLRTLTDGYTP
ncbi:cytochrome c peroxidase [Fluviicoccus keumensis]|uniref:Cytochrome c peroxidase n=1 Tax=Fluviicoccus keumensis TaxID=1435465 RepID=A0A4Q7YLT7_9GAMM|nr:cytochrome c peroxidase [Fluviicoccus keumensis]RZU38268.1 cytochrome c peroxidase [Fluviicoccus keumensis]